jgi:hypothetical protein
VATRNAYVHFGLDPRGYPEGRGRSGKRDQGKLF